MGIIMDEAISKTIIGYHAISDRVLLVKLKGQPININIIQVYAPTSESSDEDIDMFYNDVEIARKHCKSNEVSIISGDFNAKVGHEAVEGVLGNFGLGTRNERGIRLIEWAKINNMIISNTWFKHHPRRMWTWQSPDGQTRNQIDYILINSRYRNALLDTAVITSADCDSDHRLVASKFRLKLKAIQTKTLNVKLDTLIMKADSAIKESSAYMYKTNLVDWPNWKIVMKIG